MTTSLWHIIVALLPFILQIIGGFAAVKGTENQALAKQGQYDPATVNLYGPGQKYGGALLFAAGSGMLVYQHRKTGAVAPGPAPVVPSPISPASPDPVVQTLLAGEKQITDDLNAKIAALNAKAAAEISLMRKIADSRKAGT